MESIRFEQHNNLAYVTLNRPEALNTFNYEMLRKLGDIAESIRINPDIVSLFLPVQVKSLSVLVQI